MNRPIYLILLSVLGSFLSIAIIFLGFTQTSYAIHIGSTINVDTLIDDLVNNGNCTLREAVIAANTDTAVDNCQGGNGTDTIIIPNGIYTLTIPGRFEDSAFTGDLDINESLNIMGMGELTTTIDGNALDRVFHINPMQASGVEVQISDMSIQNGGTISDTGGGGISNLGVLTLTYSRIIKNTATDAEGGGIYNSETLYLIESLFSENSASSGGGVASNSASLTIFRSNFLGNSATLSGGGIYLTNGGTIVISGSRITDNSQSGIYNIGHLTGQIVNARILNNTTTGDGGGIYNEGGELNLSINYISGNSAATFGGGISNNGTLTIVGSTISDNFTPGSQGGGGIYNLDTVYLNNSTISGNMANYDGGGFLVSTGTTILNNSTVFENSADFDGNGSGIGGGFKNAEGSITIKNSIIAQNKIYTNSVELPNDCDSNPTGSTVSDGHNIVGVIDGCSWIGASGDITGTENSPIDPELGPLAPSGGNTLTHSPLPGSPAIDAGNPAMPGSGGNSCLLYDQRSILRPQALFCDIGAVEAAEITELILDSPNVVDINSLVHLTATVSPDRTTFPMLPITYTWQADDQPLIVNTSGITDVVTYTWNTSGFKTIELNVENGVSFLSLKATLLVSDPALNLYLPMINKEN